MPNPTPTTAPSNDELRRMWRKAGGEFHGPNVETGTMPESDLLPFLRGLIASAARATLSNPEPLPAPGLVEALEQIASCESRVPGDVIDIAQKALNAHRLSGAKEAKPAASEGWRPISEQPTDDRQFLVLNVAGYMAVATHVTPDGAAYHWTAEGETCVCSGVEKWHELPGVSQ